MMPLIWFLVALILVLFAVSWIWQAFGVSALIGQMSPRQRLLVALLGLLLIIIVLWWFLTNFMPVGFLP